MSSHNDHSHEQHHHGGPAVYTRNLIGLFILTAITVGASYVNFGSSSANVTIALAIATVKALLVALFFMHLKWDKPVNAIAAVAGFLFLGIFLGFTLLDSESRRDPIPTRIAPMDDKQVPTPVPASMNPRLTPPPQPKAKPAPAAEGAEHEGGEGKEH